MGVIGLQNAASGETYPIGDELFVGRGHGIQDARMSRKHFRAFVEGNQAYIQDLGSSNGTFVNGNRITPTDPFPVQPGDAIEAGDTSFIVMADVGDAQAPARMRQADPEPDDVAAGNGALKAFLIVIVFLAGMAGGYLAFQKLGGPELIQSLLGQTSAPPSSDETPVAQETANKKTPQENEIPSPPVPDPQLEGGDADAESDTASDDAAAKTGPLSDEVNRVLLAIYDGQMNHQKSHGFFTTDLIASSEGTTGFGAGPFNYKFGFTVASEHFPDQMSAYGRQLSPIRKDSDALEMTYGPAVPPVTFDEAAMAICPDCTATASGFKAIAIGNIDNDPSLDVWTIDSNKKIIHVIDDAKE